MKYKYLTEKVDEVKPILSIELDIACANANLVRRYIRNTLNGKNISNEKIIACCEGKADGFGRYSSKKWYSTKIYFQIFRRRREKCFYRRKKFSY